MTLKRIFIFLLAVGVVFSCGKEPQKESVKIITTNITVPSLIEIEEGQDITLQLRGITNISTDDRIVLRNAAGNDTPCSIVDYKDGSHLSFEDELEQKGLKRKGDRWDQGGGGGRTYLAWLQSLGLVFYYGATSSNPKRNGNTFS